MGGTTPHLLWNGGIIGSLGGTLLLPGSEDLLPPALHGAENGHVERLEQVCRVFWQEDKPTTEI
jgi:hypothetical protein